MTNEQHLLAHHPQNHRYHGSTKAPCQKRIPIILTCLGVVAVIATQYSASHHANIKRLSSASPIITKDDYIADSVVEFRKVLPEGKETEKRVDNQQQKQENTEQENRDNNDPGFDFNGTPLHVVFSTSCSDQMHWESYVFFYHAYKVKQPGTVTRIASGCSDQEAEEAQRFHDASIKTMAPDRFFLHLTPDFSKQRMKTTQSYKYMNKPFGLRSWMESVLQMNSTNRPKEIEDGVVILMDPDMVLLRPLVHDFSKEEVIWVQENPTTTMVKHGYPMAQQDGYLGNQWMYINGTFITGDPNIGRPKDKEGPLYWNTGPPYLATVKDMYDISVLWTEYAPRVDHVNPGLFAEMQGFIWATYKLNLPHTLIKSLVVSTTLTPHREGWAYIDELAENEVCAPSASAKLPIGLHYCKRYALGPDFFFSKYRLKKDFLKCQGNLLMLPPLDIGQQYDYFIAPPPASGKPPAEPEKKTFNKKQAKREAFMLCGMISAVNEAATYWKKHNCGSKGNFDKVYTIKNNPSKSW